MTQQINEDNIRVAAYYIWEQAGRPEGKEKECWIKACEQLFAANNKNSSAKSPKKAAQNKHNAKPGISVKNNAESPKANAKSPSPVSKNKKVSV